MVGGKTPKTLRWKEAELGIMAGRSIIMSRKACQLVNVIGQHCVGRSCQEHLNKTYGY